MCDVLLFLLYENSVSDLIKQEHKYTLSVQSEELEARYFEEMRRGNWGYVGPILPISINFTPVLLDQ